MQGCVPTPMPGAHRLRTAPRSCVCEIPLCSYFLRISKDRDIASARNFSSARNHLKRPRRYEKRSDCHLQAYQIETTRKLFAIEFFFIAVITFLSFGRCKRAARRANRAATQVIRRV